MKIELGSMVRDKVTGFKGMATGRTVYLHDEPRVLVEPTLDDEGKPVRSLWISEQRLELLDVPDSQDEDAVG